MKREVNILLNKAIDSLILSVELFNRPFDRGRTHSVLILLDHAFEMLLKASLINNGIKIYDKKTKQTIGFDKCVRKALGGGETHFLTEEQALTLQTINGMRDAEQHHYVEISEELLYTHVQAGVTLFRDILKDVFDKDLTEYMPKRVLPISTVSPQDIEALFDSEIEEIKKILSGRNRKKSYALAKLKSLQIVEKSLQGEKTPVTDTDIKKTAERLEGGEDWKYVFPGVASMRTDYSKEGVLINLRFTKKEGIPIHTVPEGTPGAMVVGIKRVNELSYYSMGRDDLAKKLGLTGPKTTAAIWYFKIKDDMDCYKMILVGGVSFARYSQNAIRKIKAGLEEESIDYIWKCYREEHPVKRRQ